MDQFAIAVDAAAARTIGVSVMQLIVLIDANTASFHHVTRVGVSTPAKLPSHRGGPQTGYGAVVTASRDAVHQPASRDAMCRPPTLGPDMQSHTRCCNAPS